MTVEQVDEVYKKYPKTIAELEAYIARVFGTDGKGIKELEKIAEDIKKNTTHTTRTFMVMGDRFLYEFFDEKGLYVGIMPFTVNATENKFYWKVRYQGGTKKENMQAVADSKFTLGRRQAEAEAFIKAFELREGLLNEHEIGS